MDRQTGTSVPGKTLLLFGPQALSFDEGAFNQLRSALFANKDRHQWILDTIAELPDCLSALSQTSPELAAEAGVNLLQELKQWIDGSKPSLTPFVLPSTLLNPLVVIAQLLQYSAYLDLVSPANVDDQHLHASSQYETETLGFCTGSLSAFAISASTCDEQLRTHGAAAIRIATIVGAVVDAEEVAERSGPSRSFSAVWHSEEEQLMLVHELESLGQVGSCTTAPIPCVEANGEQEQAYISVAYDENRATVTSPSEIALDLQERLKAEGLLTTDIALHGRFHWQGHASAFELLRDFCSSDVRFQLPDASASSVPTRSNSTGDIIKNGSLSEEALRAILLEQPQWYQIFTHVQTTVLSRPDALVVAFGTPCIPHSVLRRQHLEVFSMSDFDATASAASSPRSRARHGYLDTDIAVVGMSCKAPGANNLEEFWDLLCKGESQHKEVPKDRFGFETANRDVNSKRKWFGNFIDDHDQFDHKFFKKTPRECASQDPQQRQLLQIAYQAVEQSGYFQSHDEQSDKNIGCYVGVCAVDYENNIACHAPNAFSATGNLRGFIAGKVSHHFGWTGPGLTIDTACSSSAVAVHQACQSILSGECNAALAAGTHVMTNPLWYQNLAGASFLSTTGSCKPFDAKADGYCRGEAVAAVFLKKMSQAIADGDQIMGTIAATAVRQNDNSTPIFVPNSKSLADLFTAVTRRAGLEPQQIGVVEAHGTGTPVGDPAEYASVRDVFGRCKRSTPLLLSSVKGLIGHSECTSGLVSLIKTLLIIMKGAMPPQASFDTISPGLHATPEDQIKIPTKLTPWTPAYRAALINNYGASGSNASIVVAQAPSVGVLSLQRRTRHSHSASTKLPFWVSGLDDRSLRAYASAVACYLRTQEGRNASLRDLAFNSSRQTNHGLERSFALSCKSTADLEDQLARLSQGTSLHSTFPKVAQRPLILCFGGQMGLFVGLNRDLYDSVEILRKNLGVCNSACIAQGLPSIFPGIFKKKPIRDPVRLQTMLFAMQHACARSWIDCGARPTAVVGHSFGELTALCIAGVLKISDAVKMVAGRAGVVRDFWGPEKGAMMAVEADLDVVQSLLNIANAKCADEEPAIIGCYNGPRNFTLSGSCCAIDSVGDSIANEPSYSSVKYKRLNVSNAFHSTIVDPLMPLLEASAKELTFGEPNCHVERASELPFTKTYTPQFVAEHMRVPVYFNQAIQRLAKQYSASIWLEAGSASTVTNMICRALSSPAASCFQGIDITSDNAMNNLSDATVCLWKAGLPVDFWPHHRNQVNEYKPLLLPPYQFEKARHWLDLKLPAIAPQIQERAQIEEVPALPDTLLTSLGFQDSKKLQSRFIINTNIPKYEDLVEGHIIAQTASICPATVQIDLAIEAVRSLQPELGSHGYEPQVSRVVNQAPICVDHGRTVVLDLSVLDTEDYAWAFEVSSSLGGKDSSRTIHTTGEVVLKHSEDPQFNLDFAQFERLRTHKGCLSLLESTTAEDVIQGRNIYSTFAPVVDYGKDYQGVKKLVGQDGESAGRVSMKYNDETWLDAHLADSFAQVGGIWVNCMTDHDASDIYIANGIERWFRSPSISKRPRPEVWDVSAFHHGPVGKSYVTDIFVFDSTNGALVEVILGINYVRVPKSYMTKLLLRLTVDGGAQASSQPSIPPQIERLEAALNVALPQVSQKPRKLAPAPSKKPKKAKSSTKIDYVGKVKAILADLSGFEINEIDDDSQLANLGIDSLVGMEMAKEIERELNCTLSTESLMTVTDVPSLMQCVSTAVGSHVADSCDDESDSDEGYQSNSSRGLDTPNSAAPMETSLDTPTVDVAVYLAEFLGLDTDDIKGDIALRDLGVDSLLSVELRADLESKYGLVLDEHIAIEEWTVNDMSARLNRKTDIKQAATIVQALQQPVKLSEEPAKEPAKDFETKASPTGSLQLPSEIVRQAFGETKARTDALLKEQNLDRYARDTAPDQTRLCILLTIEAFEQLGCTIQTARAGDEITKVEHVSEHASFVNYLYKMLADHSDLIEAIDGRLRRTKKQAPFQSSKELLEELNLKWPGERDCNDLTYYAGAHLPDLLRGKTDGVKLIFGAPRGKELVSKVYGDWPMNKLYYTQMQDFISRLASKLPRDEGCLKILEMGAGTGGTTKWLVPLLASLNFPIEYTFTDLGPSFVAAARKKFKQYPFMKFATHDIEKEPAKEFIATQHIVVASNAVHATHNLKSSTGNIRKMLRPDGLLMMLEMTGTMYWCDMIFGLFEGWWLFDDGRKHAVTNEQQWKAALQSVGYGHVDWTDGDLPENKLERLLIGMASGSRYDEAPPQTTPFLDSMADIDSRKAAIDDYVRQKTQHFRKPIRPARTSKGLGRCILLTGATGSLGSHLLASLAKDSAVDKIICLNRRGRSEDPRTRQANALKEKNISISEASWEKVEVIEANASKAMLGLSSGAYADLVANVTHVVHNAWLMNAKLPLKGFESQFQILKNLVDLAHDISCSRPQSFQLTFEFVSSIAVVGHYPLWKQDPNVPEERMPVEAVLPNGYGDAKYVCELMLDNTLHKYRDCFKATSVRIGQIAGSKTTGYWNPMEHLSFLWKSSQTIKAMPNFYGPLSWTSVDDVAKTLQDLLFVEDPFPVYHIDNPVRQEWQHMIPVLADALGVPPCNVISFEDWIARVRSHTGSSESDNPAIKLIDFLDDNFIRMSCGGLLLSTANSTKHSKTMRAVGPIADEAVRLFVKSWKDMKFLT
jgi:acyl transferase domain-containing protein/nucleoside-diphosphate-sugar epimerase/acyl carrier protein